jgi:hypothetical protein
MDTVIALLICLIVIPVLASNGQLLPDVFASEDTENDFGGTEGDTPDDSETRDTNDDKVFEEDPGGLGEPAEGEDPGGLGEPGEDSGGREDSGGLDPDITEGPSGDLSGSEERSNPNVDSPDDDSNDDRFRHNAEEIAFELTSLSPEETREYPITDLSNNDITLVFRFLTPDNLAKVLLNIHQENLIEIKDRLTPTAFGEPLSRISEADRIQVVNRLIFTSTD